MVMVNGGKTGVNYPCFLAFCGLKMGLKDKRKQLSAVSRQQES